MKEIRSADDSLAVSVALGLLVEYTETLRVFLKTLVAAKDSYNKALSFPDRTLSDPEQKIALDRAREKWQRTKKLIAPVFRNYTELAQHVSQQIEFAALHDLDKINLQLKLHAFEKVLGDIELTSK
jgi:hypothetical protein